jgi:hypothetical protein
MATKDNSEEGAAPRARSVGPNPQPNGMNPTEWQEYAVRHRFDKSFVQAKVDNIQSYRIRWWILHFRPGISASNRRTINRKLSIFERDNQDEVNRFLRQVMDENSDATAHTVTFQLENEGTPLFALKSRKESSSPEKEREKSPLPLEEPKERSSSPLKPREESSKSDYSSGSNGSHPFDPTIKQPNRTSRSSSDGSAKSDEGEPRNPSIDPRLRATGGNNLVNQLPGNRGQSDRSDTSDRSESGRQKSVQRKGILPSERQRIIDDLRHNPGIRPISRHHSDNSHMLRPGKKPLTGPRSQSGFLLTSSSKPPLHKSGSHSIHSDKKRGGSRSSSGHSEGLVDLDNLFNDTDGNISAGSGQSATPPQGTGSNSLVPPQRTGSNSLVLPPGTGSNTSGPPQRARSDSFVPPPGAGLASLVPPQRTGSNSLVLPPGTESNSLVPPQRTGSNSSAQLRRNGSSLSAPPQRARSDSFVPPPGAGLAPLVLPPGVGSNSSGPPQRSGSNSSTGSGHIERNGLIDINGIFDDVGKDVVDDGDDNDNGASDGNNNNDERGGGGGDKEVPEFTIIGTEQAAVKLYHDDELETFWNDNRKEIWKLFYRHMSTQIKVGQPARGRRKPSDDPDSSSSSDDDDDDEEEEDDDDENGSKKKKKKQKDKDKDKKKDDDDEDEMVWRTQRERFAYFMNHFGSDRFSMDVVKDLINHSTPHISVSSWFFDNDKIPRSFCNRDVQFDDDYNLIEKNGNHWKKSRDGRGLPDKLVKSFLLYSKIRSLKRRNTIKSGPLVRLTSLISKNFRMIEDRYSKPGQNPFVLLAGAYMTDYRNNRKKFKLNAELQNWLTSDTRGIKVRRRLVDRNQVQAPEPQRTANYLTQFF